MIETQKDERTERIPEQVKAVASVGQERKLTPMEGLGQRLSDWPGVLRAAAELIDLGQGQAAKALLCHIERKVETESHTLRRWLQQGYIGDWVALPDWLQNAIRTPERLRDPGQSGGSVLASGFSQMRNIPKDASAADLFALALAACPRNSPSAKKESSRFRDELVPFVGGTHRFVGRVRAFRQTTDSGDRMCLTHVALLNGTLVKIDHLWMAIPKCRAAQKLRIGDVVTLRGVVRLYGKLQSGEEIENVGIGCPTDLRILDQGDGKLWDRAKATAAAG